MAQNKKQEPNAQETKQGFSLAQEARSKYLYTAICVKSQSIYFFHTVKLCLLGQPQQWLCSSHSLSFQSMRDPIICSLPLLPSKPAPLTPAFGNSRLFVVCVLQAVTIFLQQEMCVPYVRRLHLQEIMQESDLISLLLPSFCSVLHWDVCSNTQIPVQGQDFIYADCTKQAST